MSRSQAERDQSTRVLIAPAQGRIAQHHGAYWLVCGVMRGGSSAGVTQNVTQRAPDRDARRLA